MTVVSTNVGKFLWYLAHGVCNISYWFTYYTPHLRTLAGISIQPRLIHSLWPRESFPKRHLDQFSRFCTAHPYAQHTDTPTTLRATSVATGRIYQLHAVHARRQVFGVVSAAFKKFWKKYLKWKIDKIHTQESPAVKWMRQFNFGSGSGAPLYN